MKPVLGLALFTLLLGQAAGLPARPHRRHSTQDLAKLAYQPASPTASLEDRTASWRALSFQALQFGGSAARGGMDLKKPQQRLCMELAQAQDALDLMERSDAAGRDSMLWITIAPGAGAVAGLFTGGVLGAQQPENVAGAGVLEIVGYAIIGAVGGAVTGAVVGLPGCLWEHHQSAELHAEALESYNHKLLGDLRLEAAPIPGGAALGVSGKF
jgi:hypothetical protein